MQFEEPETFNMVSAININKGEFTVEGVFYHDENAKICAARLMESTQYVNESVSIEKLPLMRILDTIVNDRLTEISKALSERICEF